MKQVQQKPLRWWSWSTCPARGRLQAQPKPFPVLTWRLSRRQSPGFSVVQGERMSDNGHKLNKRALRLVVRNNFLMRMVRQWHKLHGLCPWRFLRPYWVKPSESWSDLRTGLACSSRLGYRPLEVPSDLKDYMILLTRYIWMQPSGPVSRYTS